MTLVNVQRPVTGIATLALVLMMTTATVSTIYWPQALLMQIRTELGDPTLVALLPGASLLGYAAGVTGLAIASQNLANRSGLVWHGVVLVAGITALAAAPTAMAAVLACLLVGAGCALTQRLLIIATTTWRPERRAEIIGLLIACGLGGIVVARAWIGDIAQRIGWRHALVLDAVLIVILLALLFTTKWPEPTEPVLRPISIPGLWCRYPTLRHAALHQAVIFAAFNAGWAVLPMLTTTTPTTRAVVAGVGALTAVVAGQTARRFRSASLAAIAPLFIAVAVALSAFIGTRLAYIGAMVLIEIGTQLALVANQTRAQAVAPDVGSRGRMASLVTAVGFVGGALGAAAANILAR
ncbi:MAG: MFS transporter [Janthinobacterium lividum]